MIMDIQGIQVTVEQEAIFLCYLIDELRKRTNNPFVDTLLKDVAEHHFKENHR